MLRSSKFVRFVLIATVLVVNAFVIFLLAHTLSETRNQEEQKVRTAIENVALLLDQNVTASASKIDLTLLDIADELEKEQRLRGHIDAREVDALLAALRIRLSSLADIRVTDASGTVRYGPGIVPGSNITYADREFFIAHRSRTDSGLIVTNPLLGRVSKTWVISFTRRYNLPDGRFAGVISAAVPVTYFAQLLTGLNLGPHGIALLRDADTALIARYPPVVIASQQIGTKSFSKELADVIGSGVAAKTYHSGQTGDGVERTNTYRRLSAVPFHLVCGMASEDYLADWRDSIAKAVAVAAILLIVTTVSAWLLWRSLSLTEKASARSRLLLQRASDGIHILDDKGNIIEASDAFCQMLGYTLPEVIGMNVIQWDAKLRPDELRQAVARQIEQREVSTFETCHRRKDGSVFDVEVTGAQLQLDGRVVLYNASRDITERKHAEEQLRIAAIAFESQEGMVVTDPAGVILRVNRAFTQLTGYSAEDVIGRTPALLKSGRNDKAFYDQMWQALIQKGYWQGEMWNRRKDARIYAEWLTISAVTGPDGVTSHYVGTFSEITKNKEAEAEIHRLAYYDPLTHLPNRRLLHDRIGQALAGSGRSGHFGALLFLDLDNFKNLNDSRGHDVGDQLLVETARRIQDNVRQGDTVARLGGDEFVVMLEDLSAEAQEAAVQTREVGEKIRESLAQPYDLSGRYFHCADSIGVALFRGHDESVDTLLRHADLAMYKAKSAGRNTLRFFDPAMQTALDERSTLEADLRLALERRQLHLHYQALIVGDGRVSGAEALLRWTHHERGMIPPDDFIPLAEETGLILPIGQWVLATACAQIEAWSLAAATRELNLAVNVSARQLRQPEFVSQVTQVLAQTGADPRRLKIELTESMVLDDVDQTLEKMHALKSLGVSFSLDDFGTGNSSLAYLTKLPLDQLKIDRSFVLNLPDNHNDAVIAQTIITMAMSLGLDVIAEGVETEAQRDFLDRHHCNSYQGYLFSRPLPLEDFELFARRAFNAG